MKNAIFWDVGSQSGIKLAPLVETHHSHIKVYKSESREFLQNACRFLLHSKDFQTRTHNFSISKVFLNKLISIITQWWYANILILSGTHDEITLETPVHVSLYVTNATYQDTLIPFGTQIS